jgi:hypothetical protein
MHIFLISSQYVLQFRHVILVDLFQLNDSKLGKSKGKIIPVTDRGGP